MRSYNSYTLVWRSRRLIFFAIQSVAIVQWSHCHWPEVILFRGWQASESLNFCGWIYKKTLYKRSLGKRRTVGVVTMTKNVISFWKKKLRDTISYRNSEWYPTLLAPLGYTVSYRRMLICSKLGVREYQTVVFLADGDRRASLQELTYTLYKTEPNGTR